VHHFLRPHLEGFEMQRKCCQRQLQMAQLFGTRIIHPVHGTDLVRQRRVLRRNTTTRTESFL
jgi:hypothetical protein